ncbi:Hint domain-containing protein [Streptomyces fungicidicus]|uniref:hypothetical protein n=1 Tax=Streptomyces fungicidicus TaxID=68203 RepID=UPI003668F37B
MPIFKALESPGKVYNAVKHAFSADSAWRNAKERAKKLIDKANAAISKAKKEKKKREEARKKAAQVKKKAAAQKKQTTSNRASQAVRKTGNSKHKSAQASAAPHSSAAAASGAGRKTAASGGSSGKGGSTGASSRSNGGSSGNGGDGKAGGGSASCDTISFVPGTKVLMSDGTTEPIEKVKGGDKVIATDDKTGETRVETVTAEIKGKGLKHLVKVTVDTDGTSGIAAFRK